MENSKQPAFPFTWEHSKDGKVIEFGLTKREEFAKAAMQGILSNSAITENVRRRAAQLSHEDPGDKTITSSYSKLAIDIADELLKQLETPA